MSFRSEFIGFNRAFVYLDKETNLLQITTVSDKEYIRNHKINYIAEYELYIKDKKRDTYRISTDTATNILVESKDLTRLLRDKIHYGGKI